MQVETTPSLLRDDDTMDHRQRLLLGLSRALAERPYAELTIADVVRHARVSKRTFYEHFADKEACFLATYLAISSALLERIVQAAGREPAGEAQLSATTEAYFSALERERPLLRAFLSEVHAVGPAALAMRRKIHQRFAELLCTLAKRASEERDDVRELSPELALAVVGGINELILLHASEHDSSDLSKVRETASELIRRTLFVAQALPVQHRKSGRRAK
jgi:AcrR family transcriptional regulator